MITTLLTRAQHIVFEWLREYGGLHKEHIVALIKMRFRDKSLQIDPLLNQLINLNIVEKDGDTYKVKGCSANPDILNAFDFMLLLSIGDIQAVRRSKSPFVITFFKQKADKLYRYDVVSVAQGKEPIICAELEDINHKYRVIIFMLENLEQQKLLTSNCEHCFAVYENDTPKFYKV